MKWRACSEGMTYDAGDGLVVYFDQASGKTHLLNEVAAWLLAELVNGPLSTVQLQNLVVGQSEDAPGPEVKNLVNELIHQLHSFDLIEVL